MNLLHHLCQYFLHIDQHLAVFVMTYGTWIYGLLFLIIFCETALIILPFLPGDSLIFAAGTLAAQNNDLFNVHLLFILLTAASIIGNGVNYFLGRLCGEKVFQNDRSWLFKKKHLINAHHFFERYGGKAIVFARFIPIARTFVPFVAGMGYMRYRRFLMFNALGAFLWIGSLIYVSFLFGNIPVIKEHFSTVILGIIAISVTPIAVDFLRRRVSG